MSIKSDVLDHLIAHEGEVVSLTALASKLDLDLEQIRSAITNLRNGAVHGRNEPAAQMKNQIVYVSRGYAVRYCGTSGVDGQKPALTLASDVKTKTDEPPRRAAKYTDTDDIAETLGQLGFIARQVFGYLVQHPNRDVRTREIVDALDLSKEQVIGALYNTLSSDKQMNNNARKFFTKVSHGMYRYVPPLTGERSVAQQVNRDVLVIKPASDPVVAKIVKQKYDTPTTVEKRLFEEVRTLPDGAILIADENGNVYKAREV